MTDALPGIGAYLPAMIVIGVCRARKSGAAPGK
jgi:hypothetical protein